MNPNFILAGAGECDQGDAGEDEENGEGFDGGEAVEAEVNADEGGNNRLNVVVHPHDGWAQVLLPYHYADVGQESAATDHIEDAAPVHWRE